jgi:Uma2 family endonuclease
MAEPARKRRREEAHGPERDGVDEGGVVLLQRWVEQPDGHFELIELPLTRELYLNPQLEDKMTQGKLHANLMRDLAELLSRHFSPQPDVLVLMDHKILLGRGLPGPGPDIAVIRGVRDAQRDRDSFNVEEEGVLPCLLVEIVSPRDRRVREMDEKDKFLLYERVGIPEYVLIYPPRWSADRRFVIKAYRLDPGKRYAAIAPDARGRLLSKTTGLKLGVSRQGDRVEVFEARTGKRLPTPTELEEAQKVERAARQAAETRAAREAEARKAAENELQHLRAEIEQLKKKRP